MAPHFLSKQLKVAPTASIRWQCAGQETGTGKEEISEKSAFMFLGAKAMYAASENMLSRG